MTHKTMFKGALGLIGYITVLMLLYLPQFSDQAVVQALFPMPFPNGTITYYQFISFFGWIIGFPIALYMTVIAPGKQTMRKGFHR